jgi:uncharacterized damage-inducible protein DinB
MANAKAAKSSAIHLSADERGDSMTSLKMIVPADPGSAPGTEIGQLLVEIWAVNEHTNQIILEHLDPAAWRAKLSDSKGRTIVAIFTHVHNVRRKWLRLSAPGLKLPAQLDRSSCTREQAQKALANSGALCGEMIAQALAVQTAPEQGPALFLRDGWAKPWPAGTAMVAYMISHEAHHRGQICMLAHQLGYQLPGEAAQGIWGWEKLWKQCGFTHPR